MFFFKQISFLYTRFRYPVSMPEEIASDLGFNLSNALSFSEFMGYLLDPEHRPSNLTRFMPREQAERVFHFALRKERFQQNSLFSYYFNEGWIEFVLQFDEQSRLRRVYIRHKNLKQIHEIRISS